MHTMEPYQNNNTVVSAYTNGPWETENPIL